MNPTTGHYEPIAREGFPFFIPLLLLSFICWWLDRPVCSAVLLVIGVVVALFFRNPERTPPDRDGTVLSPADGRVVAVADDIRSPHLGDVPLRRISIFMSVLNVHVNRWPLSGTVTAIRHVPGRFLDARDSAASEVNEHNSLVLRSEEGSIEVVQIAGKIARRIACWVGEGDPAKRGERFGLIRFGSRLDVYLPYNFIPVVSPGARVKAGESVIAERQPQNVSN
jgi:phosphatidylserine decarboxylase